ncbi:hypothetical protein L3i22_079070 [Actinoplanes sp. L3-i22]|nr:hypothetical protein L3i22_079070 [Actinoplanes sp. L3-i22]
MLPRQQLKRSGTVGAAAGVAVRADLPVRFRLRRFPGYGVSRPLRYAAHVNPLDAVAAAYAVWVTPDLPLYGSDHDRADFAP